MDKVRLNNFILWCKNWYQPIDKKMSAIKQAKKILVLKHLVGTTDEAQEYYRYWED